MSVRYLTIRKFATESGYTEKAIRNKLHDGTWEEGYVWRRAPDGRILIDTVGYEAWVETAQANDALGRARQALAKSLALTGALNSGSPRLPKLT